MSITTHHNPRCSKSRDALALLNRPIVTSPCGARLCRPAERVLDLRPA